MILGWGLLSQFPPFRYFPNFSALSKHTLDIEYHVCIWQVSPQLSCGDTCQKWKWFKESNRYFCQIENFAYGEFNERSFSNPHPRSITYNDSRWLCASCFIFRFKVELYRYWFWYNRAKAHLHSNLNLNISWFWQYSSIHNTYTILL